MKLISRNNYEVIQKFHKLRTVHCAIPVQFREINSLVTSLVKTLI